MGVLARRRATLRLGRSILVLPDCFRRRDGSVNRKRDFGTLGATLNRRQTLLLARRRDLGRLRRLPSGDWRWLSERRRVETLEVLHGELGVWLELASLRLRLDLVRCSIVTVGVTIDINVDGAATVLEAFRLVQLTRNSSN